RRSRQRPQTRARAVGARWPRSGGIQLTRRGPNYYVGPAMAVRPCYVQGTWNPSRPCDVSSVSKTATLPGRALGAKVNESPAGCRRPHLVVRTRVVTVGRGYGDVPFQLR